MSPLWHLVLWQVAAIFVALAYAAGVIALGGWCKVHFGWEHDTTINRIVAVLLVTVVFVLGAGVWWLA